jgi:Peptidase S24-like
MRAYLIRSARFICVYKLLELFYDVNVIQTEQNSVSINMIHNDENPQNTDGNEEQMTKQRDSISRTILERLKMHGQNQQDVANIFGRTRAWASQEFFGEPERTIRRLFVHQPDALNDMARIAGWENARTMMTELEIMPSGFSEKQPKNFEPYQVGHAIRFLGEIHGARSRLPLRDKSLTRPQWVYPPRGILHPPDRRNTYRPEDVYVVKVLGDSMTCSEVQHTIPEGSMVALHTKLEPRKRDIVAAWVVSLGIDVLKTYGKGLNDEVVLESYNPAGARFPTSQYELVLQGVYIGHWMEGRRG